MKIYLFPWVNGGEQVVRAMSDEGEAIVQSRVLGARALADVVDHVRAHVAHEAPDAQLVWVDAPLDHPLLRSLILKPEGEEPELGAPVVITNLCDTCVHARVCNAAAAANALLASIGACPEHHTPEEHA